MNKTNIKIPTGKITFLFTDIEGSTKLAQDYPDTLQSALDIHHSIMNNAVESNNGFVFEIIGDAFCCSFQKAEDAVKAAVRAQLDLANENWIDAVIKVRMGIHSGKVEWDGNRYMGYITLARSARVMSSAYGEQIIVSNNTYELVKESMYDSNRFIYNEEDKSEISFRDLGERRLKDVNLPVHLYQILNKGLREDFPPLKTLDARPNNLPVQLTSFIGMENEIILVKELLLKTPLLTLTGTGGSGKSRLALQVAADVIDDFENGVWIVDLAVISEPDFLHQEIMKVFELKEESDKSPEEILKKFLSDKEILIVFDNCEHLIEACAVLTESLLSGNPKLKIIATSREALKCEGEFTHRIRSLEVPDPDEKNSPEKLIRFESVRLFIERALSVDSSFKVTKANAYALADICQKLDGIPLAIELAAARTKILSVVKIHERLHDRLNLLSSGKRTALPRQKTLRALIDWSYDLLTEEEKILWKRLSLFIGGWTLEAAEEICSDDKLEKDFVIELLEQLAEKSIISYNIEKERYTILETIRQYGEEKFNESGEKENIYSAYINFFKDLSETAEPKLNGSELSYWLDKLERDHGNLESAIISSAKYGEAEKGARLAGALGRFWDIRGHYSTGKRLLGLLPVSELSKPSLGKVLFCKGLLSMKTGQFDKARDLYKESLEIFRETGDKKDIAQSLYRLGQVDLEKGNYGKAEKFFVESLEYGRDNCSNQFTVNSLNGLGTVAFNLGKFEDAEKFYAESLDLSRKDNNKRGVALASYGLGQLVLFQEKYEEARNYFEESYRLMFETGDKRGIALSLYGLGNAYFNLKYFDQAQKYFEQSLELSRETGIKMSKARSLYGLGGLAFMKNEFENAKKYFLEGLELSLEMGDKTGIAYSKQELGNLALAQENYPEALKLLIESLNVKNETGNKSGMIESIIGIAWILTETDQHPAAVKLSAAVQSALKSFKRTPGLKAEELQSKTIRKAHEILSDEEFEKYRNEGEKLTLDKATEIILNLNV